MYSILESDSDVITRMTVVKITVVEMILTTIKMVLRPIIETIDSNNTLKLLS